MHSFTDSVIYFIVVDRFANSDPSNDAGRNPESYDAARKDWTKYWGGDLSGVIEKLDYLKKLGCDTLWLTPLFDQVDGLVDAEGRGVAAYHGYWAKDFKRLDEHLVSNPADVRVFASKHTVLDRLIESMHEKNMKLALDIVCNHSSPAQRPDMGGIPVKGELYDDGKLLTSYDNDKLGWYHRYGGVSDWGSSWQVQNKELCGLADFNETRIGYRNYIKDAIKLWLDKGVDGLRVDTVKHMPLWFWQEFVSDMKFHRPGLLIFGEWFQGGCFDAASVHFANRSGMGMLDFALQRGLEDCLARGLKGGFYLVDNVFKQDCLFNNCHELVTFIDNHDMPRFLSSGAAPKRLELALACILTARGTPCIYYGTEQYLHNDADGGRDPYNRPMMENWNTGTPAFKLIKALSAVRKANCGVQRGSHRVKYLSENIYVYTRVFRAHCCFAAFNKGPAAEIAVQNLELPDGTYKEVLSDRKVTVTGGRIAKLRLDEDCAFVLSHAPAVMSVPGLKVNFILNGYKTAFGQSIRVAGNCPELGGWDIEKSFPLEYVNENMWLGEANMTESSARLIAYKFALLNANGSFCYEDSTAHVRRLPGAGDVTFRHKWAG
ncbi:MAG: cyclomaltodextrin glucanotransferase [Elusimicrobia bacterium]|nr:cyclomaltodextrin glucanotransferase [Elusimicrobiota bacterium]